MRLLALTLLAMLTSVSASCSSAASKRANNTSELPIARRDYPPAYRSLAMLATSTPRRGRLEADAKTMHLQLQRGDEARPFMTVVRGEVEHACWTAAPLNDDPEVTIERASSWWIFYNANDAVALELGAFNADLWFWDGERDCAVRVPVFDQRELDDGAPPEFYKADDVQIAYLWNYAYQDHVTNQQRVQTDGDQEPDLIESVPGVEQLVVEKNLVSILAADGTSLLRESFDVDPQWPCYNSQLTVFREAGGGVYAISSFEMFGAEGSCDAVSPLVRYGSVISRWDEDLRQFVQRFALVDELQQPTPSAEATDVSVQRNLSVAGGDLVMRTQSRTDRAERNQTYCTDRDSASGVCLVTQTCFDWVSGEERTASWTFRSRDGTLIPMGSARNLHREEVNDCPPTGP